jgi:hypothetical protein
VSPRPMIPPSVVAAPGLRHIFLGQFTFFIFVSTVSSQVDIYDKELELDLERGPRDSLLTQHTGSF